MADLPEQVAKLTLSESTPTDGSNGDKKLSSLDMDGVVALLKSGRVKNVVTMAGAGMSTSAGIPDFRSPNSGLYDNLAEYNLPDPQAIFDIDFFRENPAPFFRLAKQLWPDELRPTKAHRFVRLLHDEGLLLRHYTQNIDTLERLAGLPADKIVEAHGTFHTSHCLRCALEHSSDYVKAEIFADRVPKCNAAGCGGVVKPDIIFFGEQLPKRFFSCVVADFAQCDLLIVIGTSLVVQPFASLVGRVNSDTPRVYINRERPRGAADPLLALLGGSDFDFDAKQGGRDVFLQGECDGLCVELATRLGWQERLQRLCVDAAASEPPSASASL